MLPRMRSSRSTGSIGSSPYSEGRTRYAQTHKALKVAGIKQGVAHAQRVNQEMHTPRHLDSWEVAPTQRGRSRDAQKRKVLKVTWIDRGAAPTQRVEQEMLKGKR